MPRRDAEGRAVALPEFLGVALLYAVVNAVGLVAIDGILALLRLSTFGRSPGWLVLILPGLLFFDDLRGWRGHAARIPVALVCALVAVGVGFVVAGLMPDVPPLVTGGVGALIAVAVYAPAWFLSIRWLTGEQPTAESS